MDVKKLVIQMPMCAHEKIQINDDCFTNICDTIEFEQTKTIISGYIGQQLSGVVSANRYRVIVVVFFDEENQRFISRYFSQVWKVSDLCDFLSTQFPDIVKFKVS